MKTTKKKRKNIESSLKMIVVHSKEAFLHWWQRHPMLSASFWDETDYWQKASHSSILFLVNVFCSSSDSHLPC